MVLFEGEWELKRALMCLLGAKMYTIFRSARICALRGESVKVMLKFEYRRVTLAS